MMDPHVSRQFVVEVMPGLAHQHAGVTLDARRSTLDPRLALATDPTDIYQITCTLPAFAICQLTLELGRNATLPDHHVMFSKPITKTFF